MCTVTEDHSNQKPCIFVCVHIYTYIYIYIHIYRQTHIHFPHTLRIPVFLCQLEDLCHNGQHNGTTKEEQASAESRTESTINAAHLLVSALEGKRKSQTKVQRRSAVTQNNTVEIYLMPSFLFIVFIELPDETLELLSTSHPDFLQAFNTLVSCFDLGYAVPLVAISLIMSVTKIMFSRGFIVFIKLFSALRF